MANMSTVRDEILDVVFRDPEVKHGLRIFPEGGTGETRQLV